MSFLGELGADSFEFLDMMSDGVTIVDGKRKEKVERRVDAGR